MSIEDTRHHLRPSDRIILPNLDEEGPVTIWIESDGEPAFEIKFDFLQKPQQQYPFKTEQELSGIRMTVQPMPMDGHPTHATEIWSEG